MKYLKKYNESTSLSEVKEYIDNLLIELVDYNYYGSVLLFTTIGKNELVSINVVIGVNYNYEQSNYIDISKIKDLILTIVSYVEKYYDITTSISVDIDEDGEVGTVFYDIDEIDSCPIGISAILRMKVNEHLELFESTDLNKQFKDFMNKLEGDVDSYLSYLKDDGNRVTIDSSEGRNIMPIKVSHDRTVNISIVLASNKTGVNRYGLYRWEYVKYSIIPFITIVKNYCKIVKFEYKDVDNNWKEFNIDKIENDLINDDIFLSKIIIEIDPNIIKNKTLHRIKNFLNIK